MTEIRNYYNDVTNVELSSAGSDVTLDVGTRSLTPKSDVRLYNVKPSKPETRKHQTPIDSELYERNSQLYRLEILVMDEVIINSFGYHKYSTMLTRIMSEINEIRSSSQSSTFTEPYGIMFETKSEAFNVACSVYNSMISSNKRSTPVLFKVILLCDPYFNDDQELLQGLASVSSYLSYCCYGVMIFATETFAVGIEKDLQAHKHYAGRFTFRLNEKTFFNGFRIVPKDDVPATVSHPSNIFTFDRIHFIMCCISDRAHVISDLLFKSYGCVRMMRMGPLGNKIVVIWSSFSKLVDAVGGIYKLVSVMAVDCGYDIIFNNVTNRFQGPTYERVLSMTEVSFGVRRQSESTSPQEPTVIVTSDVLERCNNRSRVLVPINCKLVPSPTIPQSPHTAAYFIKSEKEQLIDFSIIEDMMIQDTPTQTSPTQTSPTQTSPTQTSPTETDRENVEGRPPSTPQPPIREPSQYTPTATGETQGDTHPPSREASPTLETQGDTHSRDERQVQAPQQPPNCYTATVERSLPIDRTPQHQTHLGFADQAILARIEGLERTLRSVTETTSRIASRLEGLERTVSSATGTSICEDVTPCDPSQATSQYEQEEEIAPHHAPQGDDTSLLEDIQQLPTRDEPVEMTELLSPIIIPLDMRAQDESLASPEEEHQDTPPNASPTREPEHSPSHEQALEVPNDNNEKKVQVSSTDATISKSEKRSKSDSRASRTSGKLRKQVVRSNYRGIELAVEDLSRSVAPLKGTSHH